MKKYVLIFAAIGFMSFVASCKKCYTCSNNAVEYCDDAHSASDLEQLQTACENGGGTWTQK